MDESGLVRRALESLPNRRGVSMSRLILCPIVSVGDFEPKAAMLALEHSPMEPTVLFEYVMERLRANFGHYTFFVERDVVWTVQTQLSRAIAAQGLPLRVFNDYPMLPGPRRALSTDIAILDDSGTLQVAVEFKFEPSHRRGGVDISLGKFPVIGWSNVERDMVRIREFVAQGKAHAAYAVLVDEGGCFRHRPALPGGEWRDWTAGDSEPCVSIHWCVVRANGTEARSAGFTSDPTIAELVEPL